VAIAPPNYFDLTFEERAAFLGAPSTFHLCKTIVARNAFFQEEFKGDPFYPRYVLIIVQFESKIISQRIVNIMKKFQNDGCQLTGLPQVSNKGFKFRNAEDHEAFDLTGMEFNGITPFFMRDDKVPIILSEDIASLDPPYFWFGGGRIEVKMGVSVEDFCKFFGSRVIIGKIA